MLKHIARVAHKSLVLWLAIELTGACAWAHGIVGERMFVEPLVTEDANVKNELNLPSTQFLVQPDGTWRSIGFSFEKTLYPRRFSVVLDQGRSYLHTGGRSLSGWENLELGLKWEAFTNAPHELVLSPMLILGLPTGSAAVTDRQTSMRPMLAYGKGFGDLPVSWLRPFGIQGDVGYEASVTGRRDRQLVYDEVLFYSVPYLNHTVRQADDGYSMEESLRRGFSRGAFLGDLYPFVEFNATTAVNGVAGGTASSLRPGILWMGKYAQVSVAADCPINMPGIAGRRQVGASVLVDWFLDDIFSPLSWTPFGKRHRGD
jgi:hypothetical protein